jgi:hypothetical protein
MERVEGDNSRDSTFDSRQSTIASYKSRYDVERQMEGGKRKEEEWQRKKKEKNIALT